ncbi:MAG: polysaccharide deacetylase family protein [Planctomycetota bacterium]
MMNAVLGSFSLGMWLGVAMAAFGLEPVPEQLVVLTFDDSAKSHFTFVRPLLKELGFGATFFVTEGFDFRDNKRDYMTWEEIAQLHREGFEIGNHTRDHLPLTVPNLEHYAEQLEAIAARCQEHGIPKPVSFAYPGNAIAVEGFDLLRRQGIVFARRGGAPEHDDDSGRGVAYEPGLDHPLLIPSAGDGRPGWTMDDFQRAVSQAKGGRIAVLQFHGVPDTAHDWVSTPGVRFRDFMLYLARHRFKVIAMRELATCVDPAIVPTDPLGPIEDRRRRISKRKALTDGRPPASAEELSYWVSSMGDHGYSRGHMVAALDLPADQIDAELQRQSRHSGHVAESASGTIRVLPYPGGRHPRRGFLDGAIRPQRETKLSVFAPWQDGGYAVIDVPEAIWIRREDQRQLLYLAHTHIDTIWSQRNQELPALEWDRSRPGEYRVRRELPNHVAFGAKARFDERSLKIELFVENRSSETLRGLDVQNCVMLHGCPDFDSVAPDRLVASCPMIACGNASKTRWVISGWRGCTRTWGNPLCPCIHADPTFPDCEPGQTQRLLGWLSFYEGTDIETELRRIEPLEWEP